MPDLQRARAGRAPGGGAAVSFLTKSSRPNEVFKADPAAAGRVFP
jgi:hypothetical protein